MSETGGRREQHKRETRTALREAAKRLFAEHGYQATTIREIADSAGVTERTFYRYFDGKEDLLADEMQAWIEKLGEAIHTRPADEAPLVAVRRAVLLLANEAAANGASQARSWLVAEGPRPFTLLRRSTPRPLLKLENTITAAILARTAGDGEAAIDARTEFRAQVYARVAVAALRSAIIRHNELQTRANTEALGIPRLIDEAFATIENPD